MPLVHVGTDDRLTGFCGATTQALAERDLGAALFHGWGQIAVDNLT
jgi:hypothetical protein